jgi:pyroglutamyl-peptidase
MKTVLLTGFEPFSGGKVNPSWLAVRRLNGRVIGGHRIVARRLATVYDQSLATLRRHLTAVKPVLVICVGQAADRAEVTPERVAINVDDARIPDNAGRKPVGVPVVAGGPVAYWSTLPVTAIVRALRRCGIPASVSPSAGTFVCNHVFYGLMHELAKDGNQVRGGFIHVPMLSTPTPPRRGSGRAKSGQSGMLLEMMVEALVVAVRESLRPPWHD